MADAVRDDIGIDEDLRQRHARLGHPRSRSMSSKGRKLAARMTIALCIPRPAYSFTTA